MSTKLNPTDGHMLAGVKVNENMFLARARATQLFQIAPDPREAEDKKKLEQSKELQHLMEIRSDVQRLFEGQKEKNVPNYASYIVAVRSGEDGMTPPIILFSEDSLPNEVDEYGKGFIQVPYDK